MSERYLWSMPPSSAEPASGADEPATREHAHHHESAGGLRESVNHHLRTPLTVLMGHAELLSHRKLELSPEVRESLECLLRAAQRLNDVVVDVCDLMDIAFAGPPTMESVDIPELVAEEVATYRDRAAQRGLRFVVSAEPPQECIADPRRLRRALRELLDNALTAAPDRSTVRVASTSSATWIRITVSDRRDDINPDPCERLVRPLGDGSYQPRVPADRAMGLAVASAVAVWHGGRLVLSERLRGGVEACIELPTRLSGALFAEDAATFATACVSTQEGT